MKKLKHMNMKEESSVSSHLNEFKNIFLQLTSKGLNFDDEMKAIFLLCSLPSSWDTFNTAISNSGPGKTLVFSDVTSVLLTKEIQHQSLDASGHGDAYMCHKKGHLKKDCCAFQREKGKDKVKFDTPKSTVKIEELNVVESPVAETILEALPPLDVLIFT
ncbi:hypothetical protein L7F22_057378 [Adiantum nelumboides]|nr:hypothetical protein [Adiantum nelumboides]